MRGCVGRMLASADRAAYNSGMASTADPALSLRDRVLHVVNLIRPAVQADGGDIELVNVLPDGEVQIRFHGACVGCPSATMTLQMGIERNIREKVPEVTRVVPVA
jgi:Fe-S cluster biogenesis protein NfuA